MPAFTWQKSSYCGEGDSCVHVAATAPPVINWQKSSYCPEGNSCVHVAITARSIHITESADPSGAILTATPDDFLTFVQKIKGERQMAEGRRTGIEVTVDDDTVRIRATAAPDTTVTTDRRKWDTFVLGVRAGEFDHFFARP
ncbi:DUF397 domain-containing protein [Streptomyces hirsutus]|uniref:DUF397 domain-containing protein n=1 Tax=Streptomyces hirsutus TaxID=35620 RepID=UPI000B30E920|nr:DUF397 domain-containing protein [Streptomyces hirsutus]